MDSNFLFNLMVKCLVLVICIPIHEWAHAYTAMKLGDDTGSRQGRVTLNPLAHIDWMGALCMIIVGFGWGKAVEVNPLRFNRKYTMRGGMAITAAAGPISNILMAFIFTVIAQCMPYAHTSSFLKIISDGYTVDFSNNNQMLICFVLGLIIRLNIGLAIFNLIPIPPLDGSKIMFLFLKDRHMYWLSKNQFFLFIGLLLLLQTGFGGILGLPISGLMKLLIYITDWIHPLIYGV